ncbi:hypothetical protein [Kitasatospora sp. NPDC090091]
MSNHRQPDSRPDKAAVRDPAIIHRHQPLLVGGSAPNKKTERV